MNVQQIRTSWPVRFCVRRIPYALLSAQMLFVFALCERSGRFNGVQMGTDSKSYLEMPFDSVSDALSYRRTVGYPLFLQGIASLSEATEQFRSPDDNFVFSLRGEYVEDFFHDYPEQVQATKRPQRLYLELTAGGDGAAEDDLVKITGRYRSHEILDYEPQTFGELRRTLGLGASLRLLPYLQFATYLAAVVVFSWGVQQFSGSSWCALIVASPLIYSPVAFDWCDQVMADLVATSLAVASVGFLLALVRRPNSWAGWTGLTLVLLAAYMVHPAFLFLIALLPVLSVVLRYSVARNEAVKNRLLFGLRVGLVCSLPFLAFCGVRRVVAGHFGLVSFGGYSTSGITSTLLDESLIADLPEEQKLLAAEILRRAKANVAISRHFRGIDRPHYYQDRYDLLPVYVWDINVPAALEMHDGDEVRANAELRALSSEIIKRRPLEYAKWMAQAFKNGSIEMVERCLRNRLTFCLTAMLICLFGISCVQRHRFERDNQTCSWRVCLPAMFLIALSFAFARLGLVVMVGRPVPRYLDTASVFVPVLLTGAVAYLVHRMWKDWTLRKEPASPRPESGVSCTY